MKGSILLADDEAGIRETLSVVLRDEGYECNTVDNGEDAVKELSEGDFDILITDLKMPRRNGMQVLAEAGKVSPQTLVIIITAYATVETAVEALRKGASDYILKPLEFDEVILRINHLMKQKELAQENKYLREQIDQKFNFNHIIGESQAMRRVYKMVERVSKATTNVLITGSSGTGKELVARAIHSNSDRSDKSFIAINCGAIPENLFESELFGHKKGSFTGASADKDGVFVAANKGTLFLDEIGEIPLNVQVTLLRALQEREVKPIGANHTKSFDTRIICATNRNLKDEVERGNFREDLYYRLNIVEIHLPKLNERKEDIPLLVRHFVDKYNRELNRLVKGVDSEAMRKLMAYEWKGQVRELENVIERSILLTDNEYIQTEDLPPAISETEGSGDPSDFTLDTESLNEAVRAFERHHIIHVLKRADGNRSEAARLMGIDPSTLYRKMEKLGINLDSAGG